MTSPPPVPNRPWDGAHVGNVKWQYSDARQAFEDRVSLSVSELLQLPHRRVVSQGSVVTAETGQVVVLVWLLDLHGDPSTTVRPASMVQGYLHEWLGVCARREQEAPPAPPDTLMFPVPPASTSI